VYFASYLVANTATAAAAAATPAAAAATVAACRLTSICRSACVDDRGAGEASVEDQDIGGGGDGDSGSTLLPVHQISKSR
jgi:hypothetical protein